MGFGRGAAFNETILQEDRCVFVISKFLKGYSMPDFRFYFNPRFENSSQLVTHLLSRPTSATILIKHRQQHLQM